MKVEVREIESGRLVQEFTDVIDVGDGACNMLLIQTKAKNILYPTCINEYIEVHKDT